MDEGTARGILAGFACFLLAVPAWLLLVCVVNFLAWARAIPPAPGFLSSLFGMQLPVYSAVWVRPLALMQGIMTLSLPGFLSQAVGWMGTLIIILFIAVAGVGLLLRHEWARQMALVIFVFCIIDLPFFLVGADTDAPFAAVPALLPTFLFGALGIWLFAFTQVKDLFTAGPQHLKRGRARLE
jgi:hypothetical protein